MCVRLMEVMMFWAIRKKSTNELIALHVHQSYAKEMITRFGWNPAEYTIRIEWMQPIE
jgi:hypothetical protein